MRPLIPVGLSSILVAGLAGVTMFTGASTASAATITVPVGQGPQAQMANHTGWSGAEASAQRDVDNCIRYGTDPTVTSGVASNAGGSNGTSNVNRTNGNTKWVSSGTTAYSAHGTKEWNGSDCTSIGNGGVRVANQSALGFTPNSISSFETGQLFNLGRMVHRNNPVYTSSSWFRGDMKIQFMGMDMTFGWRLNETSNNYPDGDTRNNDLLDFLNQTTEKTFTSGGLTYTLVVKGFTNNGTDATCPATIGTANPVNQFSTVEKAITYGCLWASVEQVRDVTVKKVVESPYGTAPAQNFAFTTSSSLAGSPWSAPGSATLADNGTFTRKYNSGEAISISEEMQTAPWAFKSLACVDGAGASIGTVTGQTVTIPAGSATSNAAAAKITCTYTNTYTPRATLTLVKAVTSTGQPAPVAQPSDWNLTAQGQGLVASQGVSGAGNSPSVTSQSVIAGTYKLSEAPNNSNTTAGYVQDGAWTCNNNVTVNANGEITLTNGTNTTCTVKNKFQTGTLAITKTVTSTPGGGYTQGTAKQFTASYVCTVGTNQVTGTTTVVPNATNGQPGSVATVPNLPAGANCVVTEINAPTGSQDLANTSWAWGTPSVSQPNVIIPAGATATVNITNPVTQNTGSLVITKQVTPRDGVPAAGYTGSRTFPIGYVCTIGATQTATGTVNLANGASQTITGIPATSSCTVSETLSAQADDFLDASFRWDGNAIAQASAVPVNGTTAAVVTNYFTRDFVDLTIAKKVTGAGYTNGNFDIDWTCGTEGGTVNLADGGSEKVRVPAGVSCTVVEQAGRPDLAPGYVWGDAQYTGLTNGTVTVPRGDTRTVTVTNPNTIGFNRISLTKRIVNLADQVTPGTTFDVAVTCDAPAQGQTVDYSEMFTFTTPLTGAQETPYLPIGTECSVVETGLPTGSDGLPNASFAWDSTPGYEGLTNGKVTVPQTTTPAAVTVINDIERVYGPLFVTKTVSVPSGVSVSQPFTGAWSCTFGGDTVASGTWQAPTTGGQATLTGSHSKILVGSLCSVTEDDPANPVPGDASYHWAVSTPGAPLVITTDGVTAEVGNTLNRTTGSFSVIKQVEGGQAPAQFADGDFTFDYTCVPASGSNITGTLRMRNTGGASATGDIPAGSVCTVTERLSERPAPVDPFRWDGVSYQVAGAAGTASGSNGVTFTVPADGAAVTVTATNEISAKTASVSVKKVVDGEGFVGGSRDLFPMTLTCVDPTSGASAQVGDTRDIANEKTTTWNDIPLGAKCSVQEGAIGDGSGNGLKDASFAWNAPSYSEAQVTVTETGTPTITVTNTTRRVYGQISLTKTFLNGGFTGVVAADRTYTGNWVCRYDGATVAAGTWSSQGSAAGSPATLLATTGDLASIPLTASCSATESALSAPSATDPSFRWLDPVYSDIDSVSITASENRMNVTNTLARDTGSVLVSKKLSGQVGGFANDADFPGFPVGYVCALDPADLGNASAERMLGEVFVTAGADAVTLVDGVPRGWTCAANEGSFVTATNTWLLDSSFAWGTPTITVDGAQQETFLVGATPRRVVVDNPITRQLGTIQIDKAIAEGFDGVVKDGARFGGTYQCSYAIGTDREATYSGTWSVDGEGRATLTGDTQLPYGTSCSVTETTPSDADLVDASWTWGEEIVTAAPAVVSGDGPAAFTVTNTPERVFSTLAITKALTGPTDGFTDPALAVDGSWACFYGAETVASGTWTAPAVGGAATLTPADVQIPVTSRCTVVEDTLDPSVFKDASYTWGAHPADQSATIVAGEVASVTVTNVVERVQGAFTISKLIERGPGVTVQVPGSDVVYSGTYECTYAGGTTGPLPWSIIGEGNSFTAPTQYADSVCTVLSENAPNREPVVADNSFGWGAHTIGAAVTVTPNATVNVDVTNRVFRSVGSFGVTKVVEGDTVGLPAQPTYSFAWSCTADNGDTYPTDPEDATFTLTAGQQWNPSENIPLGSSCTVTETDIPAPLHPSFTWSTAMSVAGAEGTPGTGDDPSIAFEIPQQSDAGVLVTATNTLTRGLGGFSVTKSVPEGSVVDETMTFTGAFECVGPLAGDKVTGTWGPIAAGETWTSEKNIPLAASCKVTSEERPVWPSGDDHSQQWAGDPDLGTAVVSAVEPATVTVTNATAQVLGSVTWSKVVEGTEDRLAGSTWTLTTPSGDAVTVVDCIEATCPEDAFLDQNPAPGEFLLTGLGWGGYTLVEAQAPAGYYIDDTERPFTIGSDEPGELAVVAVGPIGNSPINPPVLPFTGGLGRDHFTMLGLFILVLGLGAGAVIQNRQGRRRAA